MIFIPSLNIYILVQETKAFYKLNIQNRWKVVYLFFLRMIQVRKDYV